LSICFHFLRSHCDVLADVCVSLMTAHYILGLAYRRGYWRLRLLEQTHRGNSSYRLYTVFDHVNEQCSKALITSHRSFHFAPVVVSNALQPENCSPNVCDVTLTVTMHVDWSGIMLTPTIELRTNSGITHLRVN
jgi:hypothetical protein